MMRKLCLLIIILTFSCSSLYAQELFLRKDKYFTEVYLKLDPKNIKSVNKGNNKVVITFNNMIKKGFQQNINDDFISNIQGSGNNFTINIKQGNEFSIVQDTNGVKVVATKGKTTEYVFEGKIENGVLMQGDEPVHGGPNSAPDLVSTDELTGGKIFQNEQGLYVTENGAFTSYDLNVLEKEI